MKFMVSIPESVQVGPYKIKIKVVHDLKDDLQENCHGLTDFCTREIFLDADLWKLGEVTLLSTYLHELIHQTLSICGYIHLQTDDLFAEGIANLLTQALMSAKGHVSPNMN